LRQYSAIDNTIQRRSTNQSVAVNKFQTSVAAMKDKLVAAKKVDATTFFILERTLQNEIAEKEKKLLQLQNSMSEEEVAFEFSTSDEELVKLIANCLTVKSKQPEKGDLID